MVFGDGMNREIMAVIVQHVEAIGDELHCQAIELFVIGLEIFYQRRVDDI